MLKEEYFNILRNDVLNFVNSHGYNKQYPGEGISAIIDSNDNVIRVSKNSVKFNIKVDNSDISFHEAMYNMHILLNNYYSAKRNLLIVIKLMQKKIIIDHGKP